MFDESINLLLHLITVLINWLLIDYYSCNIRVKFNGSILRQPKVSYTHEKRVNIYIVCEITRSSSHSDDPTPKNCLFGAVTLTKNADIYKYWYSGHGIGFEENQVFHFQAVGFVKMY